MEIERKWLFNIDDVPTELFEIITDYKQMFYSGAEDAVFKALGVQ